MKNLPYKFFAFTLFFSPMAGFAQTSDSADEIVSIGLNALRKIDTGETGSLWDNTSAFVKTQMPKDTFVSGIRSSRSRYGSITKRSWAGVMRIQYPQGSVSPPEGLYANADFSSTLANGQVIFEKVTMRFEPDGWRVVGYVPRDIQ